MKTLYLLGACALLSTTLFSCTADEFETEVKNKSIPTQDVRADGPDDDPIPVKPPIKNP